MLKFLPGMTLPVANTVLAAAMVALPTLAGAAPSADSAYPLSTPVFKTLIVETVYPFAVAQYTPPVAMPATVKRAVPATPEEVMFQLFGAMAAADYDWNMSLWTPASRLDLQQRHAKPGEGKAYYESLWKKSRKSNCTLVSRVSHGRFLIIQYECASAGSGQRFKDTIALEKQGEQWFLTQALAANPLLDRWNAPGGRIQVTSDTMFKK